jgi:hypothetical protein
MVAHRTGLGSDLGASEWKGWLHLERLRDICRECLTQAVHLLLHLRHGKGWSACFEDAHVSHEKLPSIAMNIRVGAGDCDLNYQSSPGGNAAIDLLSVA